MPPSLRGAKGQEKRDQRKYPAGLGQYYLLQVDRVAGTWPWHRGALLIDGAGVPQPAFAVLPELL